MSLPSDVRAAVKAVVFDAYGTLFDVHAAVSRHAAQVGGAAAAFSATWRQKQLEYTWTHSLMGIWIDFWTLTQTSLDVAFAQFPNVDRRLRHRLLLAYRELDSYPDVRHCLSGLGAAGYRRAILSNGSADMLADAVRASGLTDVLEAIISVDEVRVFKPDGRVYQLACDTLGLQAHQVLFVSSNRWDVAGAAKFGFVPVWINRAGHPDEYPGLEPVLTLRDLSTLA